MWGVHILFLRVGQRSETVRNIQSLDSTHNNGKQINFIRKHIGGCGALKKCAKEGTQNGQGGRAKARTAGERESREEGEKEKKSRENRRRGAALRGRNGGKAGENESSKRTIFSKSGLGFGV